MTDTESTGEPAPVKRKRAVAKRKPKTNTRKTAILLAVSIALAIGNLLLMGKLIVWGKTLGL